MEGADKIKNGTLRKFSEQQLVDCSTKNNGCSGGDLGTAYAYYENHFAITSADYGGYEAKQHTCKYDTSKHTTVEVAKVNMVTPNSS